VDNCFLLKGLHCCAGVVLCVVQIAHAGSRTRVTSMGGLYDTATLRALSYGIVLCFRCAVLFVVVCGVVDGVGFAVRVVVGLVVCFVLVCLCVSCW
jgi:hypothetical protein